MCQETKKNRIKTHDILSYFCNLFDIAKFIIIIIKIIKKNLSRDITAFIKYDNNIAYQSTSTFKKLSINIHAS